MTLISSTLLRNLVIFGRLLRRAGVRVTSTQLVELASSLVLVDIRSEEDFRNAARCILVHRHDDLELFDRAFDLFWKTQHRGQHDGPIENLALPPTSPTMPNSEDGRGSMGAGDNNMSILAHSMPVSSAVEEDEEEDGPAVAIYSPGEVLRQRDFSLYTVEELSDARRFLRQMQWKVTRRRSLRSRSSRRGRRLDVRRSLRGSMRHGGEMLDLAWRGPKMKRRQLVLLCDISGSMDRYTRLLLHFMHSIQSSRERVEVFLFGTRLTRITHALRRRDPDAAIAAVNSEVHDWSGGTRIGESLHTFNRRWARRVLVHGAIVLIISDGWDRGDPALLASEMERLQRASYHLLWLNPLLGARGYEPLTQGIVAALPYVDDFLPVHNLASLEALSQLLNEVQEGRPVRRQVHHHRQT